MANCISVTQNLKKEFVNSFFDYFYNSQENNWFLGIGNPIPWSFDLQLANSESIYFGKYSSSSQNQDETVPTNPDTDKVKLDFYRTCTAMKKISNDDISFLIEKNPWKQNTVYYPYRHDQEMFLPGKKFYVYNENNRCVYKCIENTSLGPSAGATDAGSLYIPSSTSIEIIDTLDGYKWKLMYQLSAADELKFSVNGRSELDSYIPVKYINYDPPTGQDEADLQKSVQDSAANGSLSSIYVNQLYYNSFRYDPNLCAIGSSDTIYAQEDASVGATSIDIDFFGSNSAVNSLKDMFVQVVDGPGVGQVRLIKSSQRISSGGQKLLRISIDPLDEGLSGYDVGATGSAINVIPSIKIFGDGTSLSGFSAKYSSLETALAIPTFNSDGVLRGADLLDIGKQYTFASASIPKGITAVSSSVNSFIPGDLLSTSLSPLGGHGSNAVLELGASKVILKTTLEGGEGSILNATNDFRQIAIIKNPEFSSTTAIIRTEDGLGSGISSGEEVELLGSGITAYGVVSSHYQFDDNRGREFIVRSISGDSGNYTTIDGVNIDSYDGLEFVTVAGSENKQIVTLTSTTNISGIGPRDFVVGLGNKTQGISPSFACGKVVEVGTNPKDLLLENVNGKFLEGENVYGYTRGGTASGNFEIDEVSNVVPSSFKTAYNMTTRITIISDENQQFESSTFLQDRLVYSFEDDSVATPTSSTPYKANAFVFDYEPNLSPSLGTTNSAELEIIGNKPNSFEVGDYVLYYKNNLPQYAIINSVVEPDILYGTGEVLYVQNFAGIERYLGSTEEINLVLGL
jgi:hypothetical protein